MIFRTVLLASASAVCCYGGWFVTISDPPRGPIGLLFAPLFAMRDASIVLAKPLSILFLLAFVKALFDAWRSRRQQAGQVDDGQDA